MRVTSISVRGLFGVFNHTVPVQSSERVTLVHGPNGFGKTVLLRMIAAIAEGTTEIFRETPFKEFCLTCDDGTARLVRRTVVTQTDTSERSVVFEYIFRDQNGTETLLPSLDTSNLPDSILEQIDKRVPSMYTLSGRKWLDRSTGRQLSAAAILKRFPKAVEAIPPDQRPSQFFRSPDDLQVFFVETNRLSAEVLYSPEGSFHEGLYFDEDTNSWVRGRHSQATSPRVKQYSEDVVQRIRSVLADYARHSQDSDRTFPERLVRFLREGQNSLPEREILSLMTELENQRRRLFALGLLDSESGLRDLTEDDVRRAREALTIYIGDVQGKLQVFDDIAHRIGTLMDIINDRFRYKRLKIDRRRGFRVFSEADDAPINIEDLSSGEQHQLIVLYELLFRAPRNGLILVDEPEISLHVAWQSRFLSDLINILNLTDAYAIVATHSPVIIGTRNDLTVELKGPDQLPKDAENA